MNPLFKKWYYGQAISLNIFPASDKMLIFVQIMWSLVLDAHTSRWKEPPWHVMHTAAVKGSLDPKVSECSTTLIEDSFGGTSKGPLTFQ